MLFIFYEAKWSIVTLQLERTFSLIFYEDNQILSSLYTFKKFVFEAEYILKVCLFFNSYMGLVEHSSKDFKGFQRTLESTAEK